MINPVSKRLIDLEPEPNVSGSPNFIADLGTPTTNDGFVGPEAGSRSRGLAGWLWRWAIAPAALHFGERLTGRSSRNGSGVVIAD
jgi:hypothetical protein